MSTDLQDLPDWRAQSENYECPEWFRNAKFGIWAHWGPQCVGAMGDHYAPGIYGPHPGDKTYVTSDTIYQEHIQRYGHPTEHGFKDICNSWKAEKWDPEHLIGLYKAAGAKYFVCLGNHHDNFDNWNSAHQPWNSVNVGPKRDLVGGWAAAARAEGLRFGVSLHGWQAWKYYANAAGHDKTGPWANKPYDGALTKEEGAGQWWEGLDPNALYATNQAPTTEPDAAYTDKWNRRMLDVVDQYQPDLLYIDNWDRSVYGGAQGDDVIGHFYEQGTKDGKIDVVFTRKHMPESERHRALWNVERGLLDAVQPLAFQTETCIGNWHYHYGVHYKSSTDVIRMLIDVVSKNGNFLLNIPLKGDGSPDVLELELLKDITEWMETNSDAIYDTRPWRVFGETEAGSAATEAPSWNENEKLTELQGQIRYTSKGDTLYAFLLAAPTSEVTLPSVKPITTDGATVEQLGVGPIPFHLDSEGRLVLEAASATAARGTNGAATVFRLNGIS
jgi:alpha-L-fucosidase